MSDVPTVELVEQFRRANAGLRDVLAAREAENAELRASPLNALSLQVAELQRRLGSGYEPFWVRLRPQSATVQNVQERSILG